jgi:transcriptional regulator with XRE-family HTH domain
MRSDRLREVRQIRQLSQADLAERVGVSHQQIYRYESGDNDPTAEVLMALAQALEVTSDYLLGLVDRPTVTLSEQELSPMERRLLQAIRSGRIVEALKTFTAISEMVDQPGIAAPEPTIDG